jgi:hypothetical protein
VRFSGFQVKFALAISFGYPKKAFLQDGRRKTASGAVILIVQK